MDYLFVYGTLAQSSAHPMAVFLRENCKLVGKAYVNGRLYLVADYPGLVLSKNSQEIVFGYIYSAEEMDSLLLVLDKYEEAGPKFPVPQEYKRERILVYHISSSQTWLCWAYIYNLPTENLPLIPSGDFENFKAVS
ncbi:gamma-glutamylcyclotransferase [Echinicola sediminis]